MSTHTHNFVPYKIDYLPSPYSKIGYVYSACDGCDSLAGSPIKTSEELEDYKKQIQLIAKW